MTTVVFCIPGRTFSYKFVLSWSNLLTMCPSYQVLPITRMAYSSNVYAVRDLCLDGEKNKSQNQKPFQGKIPYDYIMWIDSDSVFEPEQFKALLETMEKNKNYQILSGLYPLEDGRYAAHFETAKENRYITAKDIKQGLGEKPIKVLHTGMGFMLVRHGVFEALTYPWFVPLLYDGKGGAKNLAGEDASFCLRAKAAGINTWVDPKIIIGHKKPVVLR